MFTVISDVSGEVPTRTFFELWYGSIIAYTPQNQEVWPFWDGFSGHMPYLPMNKDQTAATTPPRAGYSRILERMDPLDRRILQHLSKKDKAAVGALAHEMRISGEELEDRLADDKPLLSKDYVRIEQPFGNSRFAYITENGRKALWSFRRHAERFIHDMLVEHSWDLAKWVLSFASAGGTFALVKWLLDKTP